MADAPRPELLTALTTEHFTLQGARSQTVSESGSRAALYLGTVSSVLIALGFVSQVSEGGDVFQLFALAAIPTLYFLGMFTFVRLVESSVEDILYGRAINRIRHYYLELAGDEARLFMMNAHDDAPGVIANMGLSGGSPWQLFFTSASAVSVVNAMVGASGIAILLGVTLGLPLAVAATAGIAFAVVSVLLFMRWERQRHEAAGGHEEVLFPSPAPGSPHG
jgi:hypothetical protein